MALSLAILWAFLDTDYRVRLVRGGYASIRIGEPLPRALHYLLRDQNESWGFITAWNPSAQRLPRACNRKCQRELLLALRGHGARMRAGIGVGKSGWREPSLFVIGMDFDALDVLAKRFGQAALVRGVGHDEAELRVLSWEQSPKRIMDTRATTLGQCSVRFIHTMPTPFFPSAAPVLDVQGLAFARNDEPVFGPLDFSLHRGETLLVEGDNGSGKTTLLRVLAGMLPASAGEIRIGGRMLTHDALRGHMVFLGHQPGIKNDLSPCENLAFLCGLYGTRDGASIESALAQVDLSIYAETPLRMLSAGQKKRAALARLALLPGELWLLDEPYANLDRRGIELVNALVAAHALRGGATLLTSHGAVRFADPHARHVRLELAA